MFGVGGLFIAMLVFYRVARDSGSQGKGVMWYTPLQDTRNSEYVAGTLIMSLTGHCLAASALTCLAQVSYAVEPKMKYKIIINLVSHVGP